MSPSASVPFLQTRTPLYVSRNQWPRFHQPQPRQSPTVLMTCQPSARAPRTHGALSAAATIATTVLSHHATPQPPTPPHEPLGTKTVTATAAVVFTHHHPILTHSQTPCQSTSSKQSTICRGLPPRSLSSKPRPPSTTTCHVPPFDPFRQSTFLKWQFHPVDTHQDPLRWPCHSVPLWRHSMG